MMDEARTTPVNNPRAMLDLLAACAGGARRGVETPVIWVFRDYHEQWCVRKEGGQIEASFSSRKDALEFARAIGHAGGAYRLFFQLRDGRITQELCNLGG